MAWEVSNIEPVSSSTTVVSVSRLTKSNVLYSPDVVVSDLNPRAVSSASNETSVCVTSIFHLLFFRNWPMLSFYRSSNDWPTLFNKYMLIHDE